MAIGIGGVRDIDMISKEQFETAANDARLGKRMAMERFDKMAESFESALRDSANTLADMGFKEAISISKRIMQTGGYKSVLR